MSTGVAPNISANLRVARARKKGQYLLRGYEKSAQGVGRKLAGKYHLPAGADSLCEQALAAAGKQPGDYSGKVQLILDLAALL